LDFRAIRRGGELLAELKAKPGGDPPQAAY
jgi:hypothetical protein